MFSRNQFDLEHYNIIIGLKNKHLNKLRSMENRKKAAGKGRANEDRNVSKYLKIGKFSSLRLRSTFMSISNIRAPLLLRANAKYLESHKILLPPD